MKVKTSELIGAALDWAVARCGGKALHYFVNDPLKKDPWLAKDGMADQPLHSYTPSTDWAQGGPIIERERIGLGHAISERNSYWFAIGYLVEECGPTPLVAAMRCYVASTLGDEIDVPGELLGDDEPPEPEYPEPTGKLLRDYTTDDFNPKMKHWSDK
jgi:hypothetical protein